MQEELQNKSRRHVILSLCVRATIFINLRQYLHLQRKSTLARLRLPCHAFHFKWNKYHPPTPSTSISLYLHNVLKCTISRDAGCAGKLVNWVFPRRKYTESYHQHCFAFNQTGAEAAAAATRIQTLAVSLATAASVATRSSHHSSNYALLIPRPAYDCHKRDDCGGC